MIVFFNTGYAQIIEVTYQQKSNFSENFLTQIDQLPESRKQELINQFEGVINHYTVWSDGRQVVRTQDSITNNCGQEEVYTYPYRQVLVRNEFSWDKYLRIDGSSDSTLYHIPTESHNGTWEVDYNSTKNILGFICYYAFNTDNDQEWAWFTTRIPISLTPDAKFSHHGVVLEFNDSSGTYRAVKVDLIEERKTFDFFHSPNQLIHPLNNFREFSVLLTNKLEKISSGSFSCN